MQMWEEGKLEGVEERLVGSLSLLPLFSGLSGGFNQVFAVGEAAPVPRDLKVQGLQEAPRELPE